MLEEVAKLSISKVNIPDFDILINPGDEERLSLNFGIPGKVISTSGHSWVGYGQHLVRN
jgi:hypothetical protein